MNGYNLLELITLHCQLKKEKDLTCIQKMLLTSLLSLILFTSSTFKLKKKKKKKKLKEEFLFLTVTIIGRGRFEL
jgi:hypothetical protein